MKQENCYTRLDHTCKASELFNERINTGTWTWNHNYTICIDDVGTFLKEDPLLSAIYRRFDSKLYLFKFPAHTVYGWHRDIYNGCNINCVLDTYDSITMFSDDSRPVVKNVVPLNYTPLQWYAFNPQVDHFVSNHGDKDRYLVALSVLKPVTYEEVMEWYRTKFKT